MNAKKKQPDTRELTFYCDNARHLVCEPYTIENLHRCAQILNIKKCWFHSSSKFKHYDIPKKRVTEITTRCHLVDTKMILAITKGEHNNILV